MRKVCFDHMLRYQDSECIITGKGLDRLIRKTSLADNIKHQFPMAFSRIKKYTYKELEPIDFIDFWSEVDIYRVYIKY